MNRILLMFLLCGAPLAAVAADDIRIAQLEQEVRSLQREVGRLSQQIEQLRSQLTTLGDRVPRSLPAVPGSLSTDPRPAGADFWLDASRWQQVKVGMSELQVIGLLGSPASMRVADQERVLLYAMEIGASGFLGGSVTLRDRAVVSVKAPVLQ
jgi:outer membrane murein-binding lipoprotein Lpp